MKTVQLLHLTDTHLFADPGAELYDVDTGKTLAAVLGQALGGRHGRPDAILVTGDIAEDESRGAYSRLRESLAGFGVPVYCLPGNHDAPALMAEALDSDGFQCGGTARLGNWQLVLLDSHVPRDPAGWLSPQELARLDSAVRDRPQCHALVAVHHPPAIVGSAWLDAVGLRNARELLDLAGRHPRVRGIVGGHVHQPYDGVCGGVRVLASPSTCAQFLPNSATCIMDQRPPGYRWLRLEPDGNIGTEVVWVEGWKAEKPVRDTRAT